MKNYELVARRALFYLMAFEPGPFSGDEDEFCGDSKTFGIEYDDDGLVPAVTLREPTIWGSEEMELESWFFGSLAAAKVLAVLVANHADDLPADSLKEAGHALARIAQIKFDGDEQSSAEGGDSDD